MDDILEKAYLLGLNLGGKVQAGHPKGFLNCYNLALNQPVPL